MWQNFSMHVPHLRGERASKRASETKHSRGCEKMQNPTLSPAEPLDGPVWALVQRDGRRWWWRLERKRRR